jgi:hypothetical protein
MLRFLLMQQTVYKIITGCETINDMKEKQKCYIYISVLIPFHLGTLINRVARYEEKIVEQTV